MPDPAVPQIRDRRPRGQPRWLRRLLAALARPADHVTRHALGHGDCRVLDFAVRGATWLSRNNTVWEAANVAAVAWDRARDPRSRHEPRRSHLRARESRLRP